MSLILAVRDRALEIALSHEGVHEQGGRNRGPEIDEWVAALGLPLGQPWCAAFVVACYRRACVELDAMMPIRASGKVTRLWHGTDQRYRYTSPSRGAIFCHATDPHDPDSAGHTGIVVQVDGARMITVEGNTNDAGSREGDRVCLKERPVGYANLGFLDIARGEEITEPAARIQVHR